MDVESRLVLAKGGEGEKRMNREFRIGRCKLLYLKWTSNGVLLYSIGNCVQSLGLEDNMKKNNVCIYIHIYT